MVPKTSGRELVERGQSSEYENTRKECRQIMGDRQRDAIVTPKEQENMKEREEAMDNRDGKEEQEQEKPERRLCGEQLNIVLEKVVEQSSKELEAACMQVEDQLDVLEERSNQKTNTRTRK